MTVVFETFPGQNDYKLATSGSDH